MGLSHPFVVRTTTGFITHTLIVPQQKSLAAIDHVSLEVVNRIPGTRNRFMSPEYYKKYLCSHRKNLGQSYLFYNLANQD